MHEIKLSQRIQLFVVRGAINWLNFTLNFFRKILFWSLLKEPQNILIYKIGNIGDVICAIPSLVAVRRHWPKAKITLLTSPGPKGSVGAKELLGSVWYIDELKVYYTDDLNSWRKRLSFFRDLKKNYYDLFVQFPDEFANFKTLFRNMILAKYLGVKAAFGFKMRNSWLFKKTQIDFLSAKTEVENILDILKENGVSVGKVEFNFNISSEQENKVSALLKQKWGKLNKGEIVVAINPGAKREANQWSAERFGKVAEHLQNKYDAKIIIIGGKGDISKAEEIKKYLRDENILIAAGNLSLLETIVLLKRCSFLISNDTGAGHMASSVGLPVIGLYTIRYVLGKWFPYGSQHKILYHKFLDCDYRKEECIKKSIEMISVEEAIGACEEMISKLS